MTRDHAAALFTAALLAIGAVAIILYNHANATAQVIGALGGGATAGGASVGGLGGLGVSASLAGTPTMGQDGTSVTPAVVPLVITPGYQLQ